MKLKDDTYLRLVFHGKEKTFHYIFVVNGEVVGLAVESKVFLVEVDSVLASGDYEVYLVKG